MEALIEAIIKGLNLSTSQVSFLVKAGWVIIVTVHVAWVCGAFAFMGVASPFARGDALDKVVTRIEALIADQKQEMLQKLKLEISTARSNQCHATTEAAKVFYGQQLQDLALQYYGRTGSDPRIPRCDEV